jgi:hypothetical protein
VDTVNYGKGKLALGKILGETFVRRILAHDKTRRLDVEMAANLVVLKIHIVIPDLKVDPNQVDQRNVVTGMHSVLLLIIKTRDNEHVCVTAGTGHHELDSQAK